MRLTREIDEAERKQRELEEAELERLLWEKEKLEEEERVEQQHAVALHGLERAAERRRAALAALPPEAGPSRAPPQKPERTMGQGLSSPRKFVHSASHGSCYVGGTQTDGHGVVDYVDNSRNHVGDLRS